jgi:hypothetical protein
VKDQTTTRRRAVGAGAFALFLAAVGVYYAFVASAGRWANWPSWSAYYDTQAEGFRGGHLYTNVPVSPGLRAAADPLEKKNARFWRWDYSFFKGHFHLYWGLAPAALLAAAKVLLRVAHPVGDEALVFVFSMVRACAGALLIRSMARRWTPPPRAWAVWVATAVFALAHPTPYALARAAIYEAAIGAGACFMVAAVYLGFEAIFAARERVAMALLTAASACAGLGGASRVSLLPAAASVVGISLVGRWRLSGGGWRRLAVAAPLVGAPLVLISFAQLLANRLRFDEWGEFGQRYQMGFRWFPMGPRFLAANVYQYLVRPADASCVFPYLRARWDPPGLFPRWLPVAADYRVHEPTAGVLVLIPFVWLALGLFVRRRAAGAGAPDGDGRAPAIVSSAADATARRWRWFLGMLAFVTAGCAGPVLLPGASTMRYEADFAWGLLLLGALGGWRLLAFPRGRAGRVALGALVLALAAATIAIGVLFGFTGYFDHFVKWNPLLARKFAAALSVCGKR